MIYIYYLIAAVIVGLDQWIKSLVVKNMALGESIPIIYGFFHISSVRNRGAAFGILQNQHWLFAVMTIAVVGGVVYYLYRIKHRLFLSLALSFLLGGAIGNFIDRIMAGQVVDYLDFTFGSYHFPVFNLADSFIVVAVIMIMIDALFLHKEHRSNVGTEESQ
jgi:signal peptidase II